LGGSRPSPDGVLVGQNGHAELSLGYRSPMPDGALGVGFIPRAES